MEPVDMVLVLSFKLPRDDVDKLTDVLTHIDPQKVPYFGGQARVAVGTDAIAVIDWLEGRTENLT